MVAMADIMAIDQNVEFVIGLTLYGDQKWPYLWNTTIHIYICANIIRMAQRWTTMRMRWKVSRVQL